MNENNEKLLDTAEIRKILNEKGIKYHPTSIIRILNEKGMGLKIRGKWYIKENDIQEFYKPGF